MKCKVCNRKISIKIFNRRRCIYCGTNHIWKIRKRKLLFRKSIIDYKCSHCLKSFCISNDKNKIIPKIIRRKILVLYKSKKGYIRKYDRLKKITYSTREIADFVGIGKSSVYNIVKNMNKKIL